MEENMYLEMLDILYNLVTYVNTSYTEDTYYMFAYTILMNIEKIPNININELADMCYTSPATISRFCKELKCDNFLQFKKEVKKSLKVGLKEIDIPDEELQRINREPAYLVDKVYDTVIDSLIESKKSVNIYEVDRLCDIIYQAKKLHFYGFQFNKIVASDIQIKLLKLGKFAYAFVDRGDDAQRLEHLDYDSVAIVLSVRASYETMHDLIASIKDHGAKVVLVTLNPNPSVKDLCDKVIWVAGKESDFTESSMSGSTILKTFLDLLYVRYGILYPRG